MAVSAGAAYISVKPSMAGFGRAVESEVAPAGTKAASGFGSKFSTGMKIAGVAGAAAVGAALTAGVVANINVGKANDKLAAQLGLSAKESGRVGKVAGGLYRDAYGESIEGVNTAVGAVMSGIKGMATASSKDLQSVTAKALDFATAFDTDVSRGAQVAGQLVKTGLAKNATQAFDLLTAASQKVPASLREDVLDATDEYGQFFGTLGYNGKQAFSMLVDGSKNGMYGIDKMGDAVKEFTIRSTDMSKASKGAYASIGLDAKEMSNKILAGGKSAQEGTQQVISGLLKIKDPSKQAQQAIALFGTPIEDLNVKKIPGFLKSMQGTSGSMGNVAGASKRMGDTLNDNFATRMEGWKRSASGFVQDGLMKVVTGFEAGRMSGSGFFRFLSGVGAVLSTKVIPAFVKLGGWFSRDGIPAIKKFAGVVRDNVVPVMVDMGRIVGRVGRFLLDNKAAVVTFVGVLAGFLILNKITVAVKAFSLALRLNPIGLVVTALALLAAGLVIAYKRSETFRRIVDGAWAGIKKAVKIAWEGYIKPALSAFSDFVANTLAPAVKRFWTSVVKPVFAGIAKTVSVWWNSGVKPVFGALKTYFTNVVFPLYRFLWDKVVKPVFAGIAKTISFQWNYVVKPVFAALKSYFTNVVFPLYRFLWDKVVKPVFAGIGKVVSLWWKAAKVIFAAWKAFFTDVLFPVIRFLWDKVVKPVFAGIGKVISLWWKGVKLVFGLLKSYFTDVLFPVLRFLWDKVVKPVFSGIATTVSNVWNRGIKPIFQALGGFIKDNVAPAFKKGVGLIKTAWDTLKKIVGTPIFFVLDTIINKGLIAGFNWLVGKVGADKLKIDTIQGINSIPHFAKGGVYPGYTPGRDIGFAAVSGGEAIMRPEWARAVGSAGVDAMNRVARTEGVAGAKRSLHGALDMGGYFLGGTVPLSPATSVSQHSGYSWARWAGDFNGPGEDYGQLVRSWGPGRVASAQMNGNDGSYGNVVKINHAGNMKTLYAHMSAILTRAGEAVRAGSAVGRVGSTGNSSGPHLHFELAGGSEPISAGALSTLGGGTSDSGFNPLTALSGAAGLEPAAAFGAAAVAAIQDPIKFLKDKIAGPMGNLAGSPIVDIVKTLPGRAIGGLGDYITDKLSGYLSQSVDSPSPGGTKSLAGFADFTGTSGIRAMVAKMAAARGWGDASNLGSLNALVSQESSWRPTAQNPTSTAYGLFQFLDSTWPAGKKTSDPALQTKYGLDYIASRYGNPIKAWDFHTRNNWYDDGGMVPPGLSLAYNGTGKAEHKAVFTDQQWATMRQMADRGGGAMPSRMELVLDNGQRLSGYVRKVAGHEIDARSALDNRRAGAFGV